MQVQVLGARCGPHCVRTRTRPLLPPAQETLATAAHSAGGGCSSQLQTQATVLVLCTLHIYFSFKISNIYFTQCVAEWIYLLSILGVCGVRYYLAMLG